MSAREPDLDATRTAGSSRFISLSCSIYGHFLYSIFIFIYFIFIFSQLAAFPLTPPPLTRGGIVYNCSVVLDRGGRGGGRQGKPKTRPRGGHGLNSVKGRKGRV